MSFLTDVEKLKTGLIIFRRSDVKHRNWYCRVKVPKESRYKIISLKTADIHEARERAFDHEAEIRILVKHQVPVFEKTFADVATEYSKFQKEAATNGQITMSRWRVVDSHIRLQLIPYMGNIQITLIGADKWKSYMSWRKKNGKGGHGKPTEGGTIAPPKDSTIRVEMMTFRAIMNFAADKQYARERQLPKGKLPLDKSRRDEFTPEEYRRLHTVARRWIKEAKTEWHEWYRNMAYNFMLVMTNTGMRTIEASNLRWRDIEMRTDDQNRRFVRLKVSGKGKFRRLVAAQNVETYFDRIKAISKATKPDDFVFTAHTGKAASSLYNHLVTGLLTYSGLLYSESGNRRSTYCFRHTYATFRLVGGVDIYFLARQMGTSVKMIEDYYGHIEPDKNADRILHNVPGWEPLPDGSDEPPKGEGSGRARDKPTRPRTKR